MSDDFEHIGAIKEHFSRHRNQWSWMTISGGLRFYNSNNADIFTVVIPEKRIISILGRYNGQPFTLVHNNPKKLLPKLFNLFK